MKNAVLAFALMILVPASAYAGGSTGGKKGTGVRVKNNSARVLAFIVNPSNIDPQTITLEDFKALGGKVLNVGESGIIYTRTGTVTVSGVLINANGSRTQVGQAAVNVVRNKLSDVSANGGSNNTPEFTPKTN